MVNDKIFIAIIHRFTINRSPFFIHRLFPRHYLQYQLIRFIHSLRAYQR